MDEERPDELTRYLLGRMSEAERDRFERAFFEDDSRFDAILSAENDLIDRYVRGELSTVEVAAFESRFLASPKRRARIDAARLLARELDRAPPEEAEEEPDPASDTEKKPPGSRWRHHLLLVASWSAFALLGALLATLASGWRDEGAEAHLLHDEIFMPGLTRGASGDARRIVLGDQLLTEIGVVIPEPESFATYRYRLAHGKGMPIWEHSGRVDPSAAEGAPFFVLRLPTRDLVAGSYRLSIWGTARPGQGSSGDEGEESLGGMDLLFVRAVDAAPAR